MVDGQLLDCGPDSGCRVAFGPESDLGSGDLDLLLSCSSLSASEACVGLSLSPCLVATLSTLHVVFIEAFGPPPTKSNRGHVTLPGGKVR